MPAKKYRVKLSLQEGEEFKGLVSRGRSAAWRQTHARIVLMSDEGQAGQPMKDEEIAQALKVGRATVERVRRRCVEGGVEGAWNRKHSFGGGRRSLMAKSRSI